MIFFDTSTIIALLHGKLDLPKIAKEIGNSGPYAITSLSIYELYIGIYALEFPKKQKASKVKIQKEKLAIQQLLEKLIIIDFNREDARLAAETFHKLCAEGHTIEEFDCIIAAIILNQKGIAIITENISHFQYIEGLKVINSKEWNIEN